jgi:hypothetical protein
MKKNNSNHIDLNHDYVLTKHIKIVKYVLFLLYFLVKIMKKKYLLQDIEKDNINDYNIIKNIFKIYKKNNIFEKISDRINNSNKLNINIDKKYFERDNHKCHDTIFNNMCQNSNDTILVKKYKNLTNYEKEICKNDVINGKIKLDTSKDDYNTIATKKMTDVYRK